MARITGAVAGVSLVALIVLALQATAQGIPDSVMTMIGSAFAIAGGISLASLITHLSLRYRRTDVDTEFWAKVWMGRIGRAAFALGRRLLGRRTVAPAMTHRATELSLGMAAEQLYEGLPRSVQQGLGDVPGVLQRLQKDAQALRGRYDQLLEALADAGDAAESGQYAEARATRDAIREKLGEAVAALETIRLNLLRLHAGSASIEGLTTHLSLAAEISAGVERLIAGRGEVERALSTPV